MKLGTLYLIPTPLGEGGHLTLPPSTVDVIQGLDIFIVERARTARRFIKHLDTQTPLQAMTFYELNKHTSAEEASHFLDSALNGKDIGLLSEVGCPGVADPGAEIVALAHEKGISVVPLVGPSSILLALMASGLNGQQFAFIGYLPIKRPARIQQLRRLEQQIQRTGQTQLFIETPYRNNTLIEDLLASLSSNISLCVAADLTLPTQYICTKTIGQWKQHPLPNLHKRPTIFALGQAAKLILRN